MLNLTPLYIPECGEWPPPAVEIKIKLQILDFVVECPVYFIFCPRQLAGLNVENIVTCRRWPNGYPRPLKSRSPRDVSTYLSCPMSKRRCVPHGGEIGHLLLLCAAWPAELRHLSLLCAVRPAELRHLSLLCAARPAELGHLSLLCAAWPAELGHLSLLCAAKLVELGHLSLCAATPTELGHLSLLCAVRPAELVHLSF